VDRTGELGGEQLVDDPVALDPALSVEGGGHYIYPEMGLPLRTVTGMPGMEVRLVDDAEALRPKRFG
jgi:hypothetical protein